MNYRPCAWRARLIQSSISMTLLAGVWALGVLSLIGCRNNSRSEAEAAVRAYDNALIEAYRTGDTLHLRDVAGRDEIRKIQVLIDLKSSNGIVLESTLDRLEVISATREADNRLIVEAREQWRYHDRPRSPGVQQGPVVSADTTMRYEFAREDGHWKMQKGTTLTNKIASAGGTTG